MTIRLAFVWEGQQITIKLTFVWKDQRMTIRLAFASGGLAVCGKAGGP